ncbi:hypothetical protein [Streptomyces sp. NPDC056948]
MRTVAMVWTAGTATGGHLRRWTGCLIPGCLIHPQLEGDLEDDEK